MAQAQNIKKVLIACSMIEDEVNAVFDRCDVSNTEIWWEERGHHNDPDKLREVIQKEISRAEAAGAEVIMLAYGLCGKGAVGWHTEHAVLAIPRFDDCCNIMLCTGKRQKRNLLEAGNMYLTKGWSKDAGALLSMFANAKAKYGERRGIKVMKLMFDSYTRVSVIDTGCYEIEPVQKYAAKCAELLSLEDVTVPGSNKVLEKLLLEEWDEDIIVKNPGEAISEEDFEFGGDKNSASGQLIVSTDL